MLFMWQYLRCIYVTTDPKPKVKSEMPEVASECAALDVFDVSERLPGRDLHLILVHTLKLKSSESSGKLG